MAKFLLKTKNEQNIKDKPRVYFTCHPDDFAPYFEKICKDIFKSHDCAIYYTENMSEDIPENERETDIGRANLMVVPVTFKLLTRPCRAMQLDVAYAKENSIRILPLMIRKLIKFMLPLKADFLFFSIWETTATTAQSLTDFLRL